MRGLQSIGVHIGGQFLGQGGRPQNNFSIGHAGLSLVWLQPIARHRRNHVLLGLALIKHSPTRIQGCKQQAERCGLIAGRKFWLLKPRCSDKAVQGVHPPGTKTPLR